MKKAYLLLLIIFAGCSTNSKENLIEFNGRTMGTSYSVKIVDENLMNDKNLQDFVSNSLDSLLISVNNSMSTWQKDSEISKFNNFYDTLGFKISKDFLRVILESNKISEISHGALDITVGEIVNLWGFGPIENRSNIPDEKLIRETLKSIGYQKIVIDTVNSKIQKNNPRIKIDLSSIAKGFGVDKLSEYLSSLNYSNYLVEIGGEVRAKGLNHIDKNWKIGISVPDGSFDIQKIIPLIDISVATSGDYRNYFEKDGVRFSHTIDPRTGKPIVHGLASVTIIHKNCMTADGLATAINVLGPEKGLKLVKDLKLPAYLIVKGKNGFEEVMTDEFRELLKLN